jgi:transposase
LLLTEGQMTDHKDDRILLDPLPPASNLIADRGDDSNWFRQALNERGITPCIPPTKSGRIPILYKKCITAIASNLAFYLKE